MSEPISHRTLLVCKSCSRPLAALFKHTEEAIVSGHFPVVVPFLGVTGYLVSVIELKR
jgi:hypothetical protein